MRFEGHNGLWSPGVKSKFQRRQHKEVFLSKENPRHKSSDAHRVKHETLDVPETVEKFLNPPLAKDTSAL